MAHDKSTSDPKHSKPINVQIDNGLYKLIQAGVEVGQILRSGSQEDWFLYSSSGNGVTAYTQPSKTNPICDVVFNWVQSSETLANVISNVQKLGVSYSHIQATTTLQNP